LSILLGRLAPQRRAPPPGRGATADAASSDSTSALPILLRQANEPVAEAEAPLVAAAAPAQTSAVVAAVTAAAVPVDAADPSTWKVADTCAWLAAQELGEHSEAFKTHAVDGKLLLSLTEQDMYGTLGMTSPLRRKKLLMAIAALRAKYVNP